VSHLQDPTTVALLSAFLDGELGATEERSLVTRLEQDPALQDALDALAEQMAMTHSVIATLSNDLVGELDGDLLGAVLAGLPADAVAATPEGAAVLAQLVADGESSAAHDDRLEALLGGADRDATDAGVNATVDVLTCIAVARAATNAPASVVSAALARLPEQVLAHVERSERGYALAAAAADGALNDGETTELLNLVADDVDLFGLLRSAVDDRIAVAGADRAIAEALAAVPLSPSLARLAERAGAAALQVIAADAARAAATTTSPTTEATTSMAVEAAQAMSLWSRLRLTLSRGLVPLAAASAAAIAFVVVSSLTPDAAGPVAGPVNQLAEVQQALRDALEPVILSHNRVVTDAEVQPLLSDNSADVEAIDATGTTMVFQTAESNITVIWLAGLDDDVVDAGEQGT
jgi:hypothetical protein